MKKQNTAKLFKNGRSQAVRIPASMRFEGTEVYISKDINTGNLLLSNKPISWDAFFKLIDDSTIPQDFMLDRDNEPAQKRDII